MPAPLATFEGLNSTEACDGCIPPDTNGAVGPTQYVQMVNSSFSVYSKAGTRLAGPAQINSLFAGLPGTACANNNNGDPVVIYDRIADRWVLSQFAVPGGTVGYHKCIAISGPLMQPGSITSTTFCSTRRCRKSFRTILISDCGLMPTT